MINMKHKPTIWKNRKKLGIADQKAKRMQTILEKEQTELSKLTKEDILKLEQKGLRKSTKAKKAWGEIEKAKLLQKSRMTETEMIEKGITEAMESIEKGYNWIYSLEKQRLSRLNIMPKEIEKSARKNAEHKTKEKLIKEGFKIKGNTYQKILQETEKQLRSEKAKENILKQQKLKIIEEQLNKTEEARKQL